MTSGPACPYGESTEAAGVGHRGLQPSLSFALDGGTWSSPPKQFQEAPIPLVDPSLPHPCLQLDCTNISVIKDISP